jgi:serine/threonine-protein kinase ATR
VDPAFCAWIALLQVADDESIAVLIHHTFALIVQNWDQFEAQMQLRAREVVQNLIKTYNGVILDEIGWVPSLKGIPLLQKEEKNLQTVREKVDTFLLLDTFALRCHDENVTFVRQTLQELIPFLTQHQHQVHESAISPQPLPEIGRLYRALLDVAMRFKEHNGDIIDLCGQCLGLLGCVDSNRVETVVQKRGVLILSNFELLTEVVEFVISLLRDILVDAFRSAPSGKQQSYLAFVMQELLEHSTIKEAIAENPRSRAQPNGIVDLWNKLPESVQSTVRPFFTSKYRLTNAMPPPDFVPFVDPVSGKPRQHGDWLRRLVFTLLHRANGDNARLIFPVISRAVSGYELSISVFMLPYVVHNIIVGGRDDEVNFVREELTTILSYDISGLSTSEVENIKQCSEVRFDSMMSGFELTVQECLSSARLSISLGAGEESDSVRVRHRKLAKYSTGLQSHR